MYLVTLKNHAYAETPLYMHKELHQVKGYRRDLKLAWGETNPLKLYKISMEEVQPESL